MIEVFKDSKGEWRYRVKGANHEILVTSEGYTTEEDAHRGFAALLINLHSFYEITLRKRPLNE